MVQCGITRCAMRPAWSIKQSLIAKK